MTQIPSFVNYVIFSLFANRKTNLGNTRCLMERRVVIPYLWRGLYSSKHWTTSPKKDSGMNTAITNRAH
jgi:hypothetical protein